MPNHPGRPAISLTPDQVEQLKRMAELHLPVEDCGYVLNVSARTLKRKFADVIKRGRAMGRHKLRQAMWEAAIVDKKPGPLIFWAKQSVDQGGLGWTDRLEQTNQGETQVTVRYLDRATLDGPAIEHAPEPPQPEDGNGTRGE